MAVAHSCPARSFAWKLQRNGPNDGSLGCQLTAYKILYTVRSHTARLCPGDRDVNTRAAAVSFPGNSTETGQYCQFSTSRANQPQPRAGRPPSPCGRTRRLFLVAIDAFCWESMSMKVRVSRPGSSGARRVSSPSSSRFTFPSYSAFPR